MLVQDAPENRWSDDRRDIADRRVKSCYLFCLIIHYFFASVLCSRCAIVMWLLHVFKSYKSQTKVVIRFGCMREASPVLKRLVNRALAVICECYWVDSVTYVACGALGLRLRLPDERILNIYWEKCGVCTQLQVCMRGHVATALLLDETTSIRNYNPPFTLHYRQYAIISVFRL